MKLRIKNGNEDLTLEDLLIPPYFEIGMIDQIVSKAAMSMDFMLPSPTGDPVDGYTQIMTRLWGMDVEKLKAEKNEYLFVIKPMFEQGLETRKRCVTLILALNNNEVTDDIKKSIQNGEKLLNSFIKMIDDHINSIDLAIDLNSKKSVEQNNSNDNRKSSNSGCLSTLSIGIILIIISIKLFVS